VGGWVHTCVCVHVPNMRCSCSWLSDSFDSCSHVWPQMAIQFATSVGYSSCHLCVGVQLTCLLLSARVFFFRCLFFPHAAPAPDSATAGDGCSRVMLKVGEMETVLCTLRPGITDQCYIDMRL
jgi:hypothetical protein